MLCTDIKTWREEERKELERRAEANQARSDAILLGFSRGTEPTTPCGGMCMCVCICVCICGKRFLIRNWLWGLGNRTLCSQQTGESSPGVKDQEAGAPKAKTNVPTQIHSLVRLSEFTIPLLFPFMPSPQWGEPSALLSPPILMLIFLGNPLTDTLPNNV